MTDGPDDRILRLRKLDCCALSDALDRLKLKGQVTSLLQRSGEGRIAGRAVTVKIGMGDPPPGPPRHLGTTAIEVAGPDSVIVIEQRAGVEAGCWGGLLTLGAKTKGVAGVIADGPVRDIDEARTLGFPIFTNRTTCFTARGRVVEKATNVAIDIAGVTVEPGDYVAADNSAVIFIKPDAIDAVLAAAEEIAAREAAMAKAIASGARISDVMGGAYEHMLKGKAQ
jgi:4-hydroxy-4-methyl-2-oxoglutarate aldolase